MKTPFRPSLVPVLLPLLGPVLPAEEDTRYPIDIQRSAGGREKLGLVKTNGFADLEKEVTFIIDRRDARKDSSAYHPDDPGLLPLEKTELKGLLESRDGGRPVAYQALKEVFDSFFKLIQREDKAAFKTDLKDVLRLPSEPAKLLVTVEATFGVRPGAASPGSPGGGDVLECRVRLKAFRLVLVPDGNFSSYYANLASCELLFEDRGTGRVALGAYKDPVLLAKAAIVDALRSKLAVSFCMNPVVREALSHASIVGSREKTILGDSIAAFERSEP